MQRRRRNDPADASDNPILVRDPLREAAVIARFKRGLGYIEQHYLIARVENRARVLVGPTPVVIDNPTTPGRIVISARVIVVLPAPDTPQTTIPTPHGHRGP